MIKLENVTKKYDNLVIVENVNVSFSGGLVGIVGESGSGKSTILNLISGLDTDYEGNIYFNEINYKDVRDKEKFRFDNFSFVFQTPTLFNSLSVFENICFSLPCTYENELKVKKLLSLVNLKVSLNQKVNTLSGGEKQRLSLARGLFTEANVLICDELTAPLDHRSKEEFMDILKKISKDKLVIVVSHEKLLFDYADAIYILKDKKLTAFKKSKKTSITKNNHAKNSLDFKMMKSFVKNNLNSKKIRSTISYLAISLGLTCIGLSFLITENVSKSIENSLFSSFNQNQKIIKFTNDNEGFNEKYACNEEVYNDLKNKYEEVENIGVYYFADFENLFNNNYFTLELNSYSVPFSELSLQSINDYYFLKEEVIYPQLNSELTKEEMILSLRDKDIKRICQNLNITYSAQALTNYLNNNSLSFILHVDNPSWSYKDEIYFEVNHFIVSDKLAIYHTYNKWNEYIFEERMFFKSSNDLLGGDNLPWTFKKVFYLQVSNSINFINKLYLDYSDLYFDFIDKNRIYITKQNYCHLDYSYLDKKLKNESYFYASNNIYFTYDKLLISSFSNLTFLVKNEDRVISLIDELSFSEDNINALSFENNEFIYGSIAKLLGTDNLYFEIENNIDILYGRKSNNYQEIVLSNKIIKDMFSLSLKEALNKTIYFLTLKETIVNNELYYNSFCYCPLTIVGISNEENENIIYGDKMWLSNFYVDNFNYSFQEVLPNYCVVNNLINENINDDYVILNPNQKIMEDLYIILNYIQKGLLLFSMLAIFSSILMNIITTYLFILENKKQMVLLLTLGISKTSIMKLYLLFSLEICLKAFKYTFISLFSCDLMVNYQIFKTLNNFSILHFSKMIFIIAIISLITSLLIGLISSFNVIKKNSLKKLKEE